VNELTLCPDEIAEIRSLIAGAMQEHTSAEDEAFLNEAFVYAAGLPRRIRAFLNDFKQLEPAGGFCVISGHPIDEAAIGETPPHWHQRPGPSPTLKEELLLVLYGCLLGEPVAWTTQQNGQVIHNVLPIRENAKSQLGSNSEEMLWWHCEDAFHPLRGDYLLLECLRNPDDVGTTVACIDDIRVSSERARVLSEPRFVFRPDESHRVASRSPGSHSSGEASVEAAHREMQERVERGEKCAVLFGDPSQPYLRIDPYFMDRVSDDPEAQAAFDWLTREIDAKLVEVVLRPGDILVVDNYRSVHGRRPFKARFDGTDRWLKRINVTRDLRRSRAWRASRTSRKIL
jgi:Fe(II)/alpha-ketoglutarate-dependent arginine beta-hydroxylase